MSEKHELKIKPKNELDFGSDDESVEEKNHSKPAPKNKITKTTKTNILNSNNNVKPKFTNPFILRYLFAVVQTYDFKSWTECFPNNQVMLRSLVFKPCWNDFFNIVMSKPYYNGMERILSKHLEKNEETIVPHAELVFNALNVMPINKIKVVFIGQDPYYGFTKINNKNIPQAMGLCFSVPLGFPKPPSLKNIYENLLEYHHIQSIPESGCLSSWVVQGCLMLNAALTTFFGKAGTHRQIWESFTKD